MIICEGGIMDNIYRLLVVDDDPDILFTNKKYLSQKGYVVDVAYNSEEALFLINRNEYACILLDVLLPEMSGFELCRQIRKSVDTPVLFLSCLDDTEDKVKGLLSGGDDYISKPYSLKELSARVFAHIRREEMKSFSIDYTNQILQYKDNKILLAYREFRIFTLLYEHPDEIFSAGDIYQIVWEEEATESNTVAVHIRKLRKKLESLELIGEIKTVRSEGYSFVPRNGRGPMP